MRSKTSQRHLSFVESGRTQPSRSLMLNVAEALDIPLRARNEILLCAGYAPYYPERTLDAPEMSMVNGILRRIIEHHHPYPAIVLDGAWNLLMRNNAASFVIRSCVSDRTLTRIAVGGKLNFVRLLSASNGMRPHLRSWPQTGRALLSRLRREAAAYPGSQSETLLLELLEQDLSLDDSHFPDASVPACIPMEILLNGFPLKLVTTVSTFGTPLDVTLQELHIEMSFPADDASERFLQKHVVR